MSQENKKDNKNKENEENEQKQNNIKIIKDNEIEEKKDKIPVNNKDKDKNNNKNSDKDDNMKEIFIRNIGYTTSEEKLKELFTQLIPENTIEFCLLCKDKETQNNKGSAFIKLTKESYNKIMSLYNDYSNKKTGLNEMNPFELEGRYLKLFDAMTREDLKNLEKEKDKKIQKEIKQFILWLIKRNY